MLVFMAIARRNGKMGPGRRQLPVTALLCVSNNQHLGALAILTHHGIMSCASSCPYHQWDLVKSGTCRRVLVCTWCLGEMIVAFCLLIANQSC